MVICKSALKNIVLVKPGNGALPSSIAFNAASRSFSDLPPVGSGPGATRTLSFRTRLIRFRPAREGRERSCYDGGAAITDRNYSPHWGGPVPRVNECGCNLTLVPRPLGRGQETRLYVAGSSTLGYSAIHPDGAASCGNEPKRDTAPSCGNEPKEGRTAPHFPVFG